MSIRFLFLLGTLTIFACQRGDKSYEFKNGEREVALSSFHNPYSTQTILWGRLRITLDKEYSVQQSWINAESNFVPSQHTRFTKPGKCMKIEWATCYAEGNKCSENIDNIEVICEMNNDTSQSDFEEKHVKKTWDSYKKYKKNILARYGSTLNSVYLYRNNDLTFLITDYSAKNDSYETIEEATENDESKYIYSRWKTEVISAYTISNGRCVKIAFECMSSDTTGFRERCKKAIKTINIQPL